MVRQGGIAIYVQTSSCHSTNSINICIMLLKCDLSLDFVQLIIMPLSSRNHELSFLVIYIFMRTQWKKLVSSCYRVVNTRIIIKHTLFVVISLKEFEFPFLDTPGNIIKLDLHTHLFS